MPVADLHPLLQRQLRRLGLAAAQPPSDAAGWAELLRRVGRTYVESEQDRYLLERSQALASTEMGELHAELHASQALNTVFVVVSNDEGAASDAWKLLSAESVPNSYILEGGVNQWISTFGADDPLLQSTAAPASYDSVRYQFGAALGDRYAAARPNPHEWELEFLPKVQLQVQRDKSGGGCG